MPLFKTIARIQQIHNLIHRNATGTAGEFAHKLGISRSMLKLYLRELRDMGATIKYNSWKRSYMYVNCEVIIQFKVSRVENKN